MMYTVKQLADEKSLDTNALYNFCQRYGHKYGVFMHDGELRIISYSVDALLQAAKERGVPSREVEPVDPKIMERFKHHSGS